MELRTLRYFVAVADAGSVNAAAQRLHLTQPSLARQLHRLERRLNLTLLESRGGRLVLTSAGRSFLPHARDLLARADAATAAVAELAAGRLPVITVAAQKLAVSAVLAPFIAGLGADDLCPTVVGCEGADGYRRLDADVDLVLAATPPAPGLDRLRVVRIPIVAYARRDHPLAGRVSVEVTELAGHRLVATGAATDVRRRLDSVVGAIGAEPARVAEVASERLAQALAAAGRGVAVVTDGPRFDLLPIRVLDADGGPLVLDLYAGWKPEHHAAEAVATLARRLQRSAPAAGRDESAA